MPNPIKVLKYVGLTLVAIFWLAFLFSWTPTYEKDELVYGVTFSSKHSRDLGLDWKANYIAMLDELGIKKVRLPVYWDLVQPEDGRYDWEDLDWQVDEAERRGVELILVMGNRVPRWPECHFPGWTDSLSETDRQEKTIEYIRETITRYKQRPTITYWQIENEPFLPHFGECPPLDKDFLDREIAEAHSLDTRPVIVTDSGELSFWVPAAKRADVFGTTLYLDTYSSKINSYVHYPITPVFFRIKKNVANLFAQPQDWIVIELQGEPWGKEAYQHLTQAERDRTMNPEKFVEMVEFVRQTGFRTFYWWGVEWWYWEKETQHNDFYWNEAKRLFAEPT